MYIEAIDRRRPSIVSAGLISMSAVFVCALLTLAMPLDATHTIFATLFVPAVLASAWYGGAAAGLMATILSSATMVYFVIEPVHKFRINSAEDVARLCAFLFVGAISSFGVAFERRILLCGPKPLVSHNLHANTSHGECDSPPAPHQTANSQRLQPMSKPPS
jgi:Domain of unknown function (DUF4118)